MPNPRLEQFALDLHQEVLAAAGIDAEKATESNASLREEVFRDHLTHTAKHPSQAASKIILLFFNVADFREAFHKLPEPRV